MFMTHGVVCTKIGPFYVLGVSSECKFYKFHLGTRVVNVVVIIISCLCNLVGMYKYKSMFYSMGVALVPIFGMLIHSITEYDAVNDNGACWPRTLLSGIDWSLLGGQQWFKSPPPLVVSIELSKKIMVHDWMCYRSDMIIRNEHFLSYNYLHFYVKAITLVYFE